MKKVVRKPSPVKNIPEQATPTTGVPATEKTFDKRATEDLSREFIPMDAPWQRLSHPDIPGYHCHWFNDTPGRIARATNAGYQFVTQEEAPFIGDRDNDPSQKESIDSRVSQVVGSRDNGNAITAYLMKIPQKLYDHQQRGREARELEKLAGAMREGQEKNVPGSDEMYPTGPGMKAGPQLE